MAEKGSREEAARRHVAVMKVVFEKETQAAIEAATIVEAGYAPALPETQPEAPTKVQFSSGDLVGAILRAEKPVAVLDDASYRYAGGGYLRGWHGPEEDLCAESNLQLVLDAFQKDYYEANRQTASGELYTSRALAIPDVAFSRKGETVACSVCVMAAPNRSRALQRNRSTKECDLALDERVNAAMQVLTSFGAHTVVLPAFGCGQSGNDATKVAQAFLAWIEAHDGVIPQVEFALWRGADADAFKAVFKHRWQDEKAAKPQETAIVEDDDEEEDWEKYRISE